MNLNTLGDLSLDLTDMQRSIVQSSNGKNVSVTCTVIGKSGSSMVKIVCNYSKIDVEVTIVTSDDKTSITVSIDKNIGDGVTRKLPTPSIRELSGNALNFNTILKSADNADIMHISVNNAYVQRVVIENDANVQLANATVLGDRIVGFVSCDCCDEIKIQMLCMMLAVLITDEIGKGNNHGIIYKLGLNNSIIGVIGHSETNNIKVSLSELLSRATGNK